MQILEDERELKRLIKKPKPKKGWWSEFPELIPWDSSLRVIKTWQAFLSYQYRVKCYGD